MIRVFQGTARDGAGNIIQNGNITCYLHGTTTPVTIYTDQAATILFRASRPIPLTGLSYSLSTTMGPPSMTFRLRGWPTLECPLFLSFINISIQHSLPRLTSTGPQGPAAPTLYSEPEPADEPCIFRGSKGRRALQAHKGRQDRLFTLKAIPPKTPYLYQAHKARRARRALQADKGRQDRPFISMLLTLKDIPMIAPIVGPVGPQGIPGASVNPTRTRQVLTSSSGTYTTPIGVAYLWVRMVGVGQGSRFRNSGSGGPGRAGETAFGSLAHCYGASGGG